MFRGSHTKLCASPPSSSCYCFSLFEKYKYHIGGGVAFTAIGTWILVSSTARRRLSIEISHENRISAAEEVIKTQATSIKRLQQDLKVTQTAVLGQESTIRKLSDSLIALESQLAARSTEMLKAIENSDKAYGDASRQTESELQKQRRRLAELHASRAETEVRLRKFEKQVKLCREIPAPIVVDEKPVVAAAVVVEVENVAPAVAGTKGDNSA